MSNELSRPSGPASTAVSVAARPQMLALMDPTVFEQMQRVGKMLALSALFPAHLKTGGNDTAIANAVLVLNMAMRLNEDPLTVAQNIYFVGGRPGFAATYMISKANQHGVFEDQIDWDESGDGDSLSLTAFAVLAKTGKRVSMTTDMKMAKAEGWTKNAKYQSMPKVMLRYRSATALIRMYCPQVMIGIPPIHEVEDDNMRDVSPDYAKETLSRIEAADKPKAAKQIENVDPETGEVTTEDAPPVARRSPRKAAEPKNEAGTLDLTQQQDEEAARLKQQEEQRRADDEERQRMQAERDAKAKADKEAKDRADKDAANAKAQAEADEAAARAKADKEAQTADIPEAADLDQIVGDTGNTLGQLINRVQDHAQGDLDDGASLEDTLDMYSARLKVIASVSQSEHDQLIAELNSYAEAAAKARKGRG